MSSRTLYRLSGISLLLGGVLSVVYYFTQSLGSDADVKWLTSSLFLISSVIGFIGGVLVLLGLPGMCTRQAERAGILGLLGFLCIAYITLAQGVLLPFTSITIEPLLAASPNHALQSLATTPPPAFGPFFLLSLLAQIVGIPVLAIATLRARVFPRWPAWILIGTLVVALVSFLPFSPPILGNVVPVIGSLALAGFGYALLMPQRGEAVQSVPASTKAEVRA